MWEKTSEPYGGRVVYLRILTPAAIEYHSNQRSSGTKNSEYT